MACESGGRRSAAGRALAEVLVAFGLFAAAGAWPAPDVNETVYLTKARHHADPAWGRGDFFLETPDAHGVFFMLFGPVAAAVSLETAAWIGRVLGWLAVAVGFRHAIVPFVTTPWARLVAAAAFPVAISSTTAAGEWVIGGCEAKVFAWAFVLGAVGEVGRGRFGSAWFLSGTATACHPIVGGWSLAAIAMSWLATRRTTAADDPTAGDGCTVAAAWLLGGIALAACGIVPAAGLSVGVDAATRAAANVIYVVERLSHHLLPRTFAAGLVSRHVLAIAVWWLLWRLVPTSPARTRLVSLVAAALAISAVGWLVSLAEPVAPTAVHALLRYYWFRLADVLVPFALVAAIGAVLEDDAACRRVASVRPTLVRAVAVGLLALAFLAESAHWPLPGRVLPPRADSKVAAAAWADACAWVRDHAPPDACFLTPRNAASFTWRTGRREVVCWKNSPQDPRSLVEWRRRIADCFSRDGTITVMETSPATIGVERMLEVAARYGADHAIVPHAAEVPGPLPFPRLYENATYAVVRLEPLTAGGAPAARP